jgi:hypothetical protein
MTITLLVDAKHHPRAFRWNGGVPREEVDRWLADGRWTAPLDLVELWTQVGGGELFETETIFQPCLDGVDDIDEQNDQLVSLGLPLDLLVFHRGLCISAVDQLSGEVVTLEPDTFGEVERFPSFDEWYCRLIRPEFAGRYGVEPPRRVIADAPAAEGR